MLFFSRERVEIDGDCSVFSGAKYTTPNEWGSVFSPTEYTAILSKYLSLAAKDLKLGCFPISNILVFRHTKLAETYSYRPPAVVTAGFINKYVLQKLKK